MQWKYAELTVLAVIVLLDFNARFRHFDHLRRIDDVESNGNKSEGLIVWTNEVKHFLSPLSGDYVHEPMAKCFYDVFLAGLRVNRRVLANLVTLAYLLMSIPTIWLLGKVERKYLLYRQLACVIFQVKNVMDYLDGAVIRNGKSVSSDSSSSTVDYGRYFDGIANGISTICFFIGSFIYIWRKHLKNTATPSDKSEDGSDEAPRKFSQSKLLLYMGSFLLYFVVASLGWDIVLHVYTKEVIFNKKTHRPALKMGSFLILHLWRLFSGLSIQDFYCCYVFFGKDLLFMQKFMRCLLIAMTITILITCINSLHLNYAVIK